MQISFYCKICEAPLEIEVNVEPYIPARLHGHPDTWSPEEGGDIEIVEGIQCDECKAAYSEPNDIPDFYDLVEREIKSMKYDYDGPDRLEED